MEEQEETLGKTLEIDTQDGTTEERSATTEEAVVTETVPQNKLLGGLKAILKAISSAVAAEQISTAQAKQLRTRLGIHQSYFTRKARTPEQRKARRKIQKQSRRKNRGRVRGSVNRKGQRYHTST